MAGELRIHARRLTLAVLQFAKGADASPGQRALKGHLEHLCVELSLAVQHGEGRNVIDVARNVTGSLGTLLTEAYRNGLIGSFEHALMVRELSFIIESLDALLPRILSTRNTHTGLHPLEQH